jgi:hypothetical protein
MYTSQRITVTAKYVGEEHLNMMSELCSLVEEGRLRPPAHTVSPLTEGQFKVALENSMTPMIGAKQLLDMHM